MKRYRSDLIRERLTDAFDSQDVETVLTWLISNDGRKPVVVVGAGFSRNGKNRTTELDASRLEVPLWNELLARFATDLQLSSPQKYDALTLAELYYGELGPAKFNSVLLDMLKDDELIPGKAHIALFNYPVEAVITTNHLDTLLDKNDGRWTRVTHDTDLALHKTLVSSDRSTHPPLIYFHGHRCNCSSWVFTRGQYEDLPKERPVMVTKVRQLLSQYPVLIVGYSLSDPDFHQIYRQISLDMAYHHPIGLALFPSESGPSGPERRHWEKLGIRIATFNNNLPLEDAFALFFGINPSPSRPIEKTNIKKHVQREPDFFQRRNRAEDFLSDPKRGELVRTDRHHDFSVWLAVLEGEFSVEEWTKISSITVNDVQGSIVEGVSPGKVTADSFQFCTLAEPRFSRTDCLSRQIDRFLGLRPDYRIELARWMTFAIEEHLIDVLPDKRPFVSLLSWLWLELKSKQRTRQWHEAAAVIKNLLRLSLRYEYTDVTNHIRDDAKELCISIPEAPDAIAYTPEFFRLMRVGFDSMLNRKYLDARTAYAEAAELARRSGKTFEQWVAFQSELSATSSMLSMKARLGDEGYSKLEAYWNKIKELEQTRGMNEWLSLAEKRRADINNQLLDEFVTRRYQEIAGGQTHFMNRFAYDYWTTFRDLETINASPSLQRRYIQPLIDIAAFPLCNELRYRLQLGVDKTEKTSYWLRRIINNTHLTAKKKQEQDQALVAEFFRTPISLSEKQNRLALFSEIAEIFGKDDLDPAFSFLLQCKQEFGVLIETGDFSREQSSDYADAWISCAALDVRQSALEYLTKYVQTLSTNFEAERFINAIERLNLSHWIQQDKGAADTLATMILRVASFRASSDSTDEYVSERDESVARALATLLERQMQLGRSTSDGVMADVRQWAKQVLEKRVPNEHSSRSAALAEAARLALLVAETELDKDETIKSALARTNEEFMARYRKLPDLEGPISIWLNLCAAGVQESTIRPVERYLWDAINDQWTPLLEFIRNNPSEASAYASFFSQFILSQNTEYIDTARSRLRELLTASPTTLRVCHKILHSKFCGDQWTIFLQQIQEFCGLSTTGSTAAKFGIVGLVLNWLAEGANAEDVMEFEFLIDTVFEATADANITLANNAAYAVVAYARYARTDREIRRVVQALRKLSVDPRLAVRGAAAYSSKKLQYTDVAESIRKLAMELDQLFQQDTYALIQRQRTFGELDGKDQPQRTQSSPNIAG